MSSSLLDCTLGLSPFFSIGLAASSDSQSAGPLCFCCSRLQPTLQSIEQRPPVLRAALMAVVLLAGGYFFRRLELLNSAAIAAIILLIARPLEIRDSSFQLSLLSIGCIAGFAVPWMGHTIEPYLRGLRGWRDVTRDASHPPRVVQFRIDLRSVVSLLTGKLPRGGGKFAGNALVLSLRVAFRVWELVFLTLVLQVGMSPLILSSNWRIWLARGAYQFATKHAAKA